MRMKLTALTGCMILALFVVISDVSAEAGKGAKRKTGTLSLENGLDVLLISDPDVHRSAAALSVGIGYLYDPIDRQGLAHYLEHMLFLGTKKYPEVDSYNKFLDEHSGASNAYTSGRITNYFFQVSHAGFREALDRFSQFFKAPLFDKTYAAREVKAVNNEHEKNKLSDGWRGRFVQNLISEPGHPLRKFGTGNSDTLAGNNAEALNGIYKEFYSAANMKLAMISSMPMEIMAKAAAEFFGDIPRRRVALPHISADFRIPLKGEYRLLQIKTIKDVRQLEIDFPTIRLTDYKESKPALIIGSVLGYEGKGSLLSRLKDEGLALGLSAGGGSIHPNLNSFSISVSLTPKGLNEYKRVLRLIFSYIKKVKKSGIKEYSFKESQAMAQIDFDWKNPDEGMRFVAGKAAKMHEYSLEDMETLPYLITRYEPDAYRALLDTLSPENALVTLSHNMAETDRVAPYYDAAYSFKRVGGREFDELKDPVDDRDTHYPARNDFIPYNLEMIEAEPHLIYDGQLARVWFRFDDRFAQPKLFITFRIETPLVYRSPRDHQLALLYEAAVGEGLNEIVYPIQTAGLSYSLSVNKEGVVLTIGGYSEHIDELLQIVARNLTDITIDVQKFDNIKDAMVRSLQNQKLAKAYARGGYYNRLMWMEKQYTEEESLEALVNLTLEDLRKYVKRLYSKAFITGMVYGNWTDEKAANSVALVIDAIKCGELPESERFTDVVEVLGNGERFQFSREVQDNNSSLSYAIQAGEKGFAQQAVMSMIASIVENDFYTQMRTNQQLGYIVWSFPQVVEDRTFFRLVIQSSTHGPFEMRQRVNKWLLNTDKLFEAVTSEEFERYRQGLIVSLEKEPDSMAGALTELYMLATKEKGDFQYKKRLIHAVRELEMEDVVSAARKLFIDPETPRVEVLMRAAGSDVAVPNGVISEVAKFKAAIRAER